MAETAGLGRVVWHELQSQDVGRSRVFYEELFDWRIEAPNGARHALLRTRSRTVGSMTKLPAPFGPTRWVAYVSVSDSRAAAERALALGCRVVAGTDVDGHRATIMEDALGARFGLVDGARPRRDSDAAAADPGGFCWDQLHTRSAERLFALYSELFGWARSADARLPAWSSMLVGGAPAAGLVQGGAEVSARWLSYVRVDDLDAACARAQRLGGQVSVAPTATTPVVGRFAVLRDPLGAQIGACAWPPPAP
jgi:uncharacterized protein